MALPVALAVRFFHLLRLLNFFFYHTLLTLTVLTGSFLSFLLLLSILSRLSLPCQVLTSFYFSFVSTHTSLFLSNKPPQQSSTSQLIMGWSSSTEIILGDRLTAEDLFACAEKTLNGGYASEENETSRWPQRF
jgi:hypothetical protein